MAKTTLKTQPTEKSAQALIDALDVPQKRQDSQVILDLMRKITAAEPVLWGDSLIGFGRYKYRYASGREGEWFLTGFSPRKQNLTLYLMSGFEQAEALLARLGKYKTGKACLYVNKLSDINLEVLEDLIRLSVSQLQANNPD